MRVLSTDVAIVGGGAAGCYAALNLRKAGIEPTKRKVLAVKSAHHFRAAYAPIASQIIVVDDGGGLTSRNYKELPYKKVRRPVYPLDLD